MEPASKIESIKIQGFRSLANVELTDLPNAAVLIGPNGSGKSNVFLFLEMLRQMLRYRRLGEFVARHGGADDQLFGGSSQTNRIYGGINVKTEFGAYEYQCRLSPSFARLFLVELESIRIIPTGSVTAHTRRIDNLSPESDVSQAIKAEEPHHDEIQDMVGLLGSLGFHQFHNTDFNSNIKKSWDVTDSVRLRPDGGNLAAVLYRLEQEDTKRYDYICNLINRILPTFDRFDLEESYGKVLLRWKAVGSDKTMGRSPDLRWLPALLLHGNPAEPSRGYAAQRHPVGRTRTRPAPVRRGVGGGDDQANVPTPPDYCGYSVAVDVE